MSTAWPPRGQHIRHTTTWTYILPCQDTMSACSSDVVRFSPCHDGLCREALHIEVSAAAAAVEASNYEKVARAAVETSSSRYYSLALLSGEGRRCRTLDAMRTRSAATTGLIIQCSATRSCSSPIVTSHCQRSDTALMLLLCYSMPSSNREARRCWPMHVFR